MSDWKSMAEDCKKRMDRIAEIMEAVGDRRPEAGVLRVTMSAEITAEEIHEIQGLLKSTPTRTDA